MDRLAVWGGGVECTHVFVATSDLEGGGEGWTLHCPCHARAIVGLPRNSLASLAPRRSDDNASVKPKMLYASSKDALKKALTGINEEYQATERGDLDEAEIKKKAGSV
jgi:hypothetical protein